MYGAFHSAWLPLLGCFGRTWCYGQPPIWPPLFLASRHSHPGIPSPTLGQSWPVWPIAYGKNDGMPFLRLDYKAHWLLCSIIFFLGSLTWREASPSHSGPMRKPTWWVSEPLAKSQREPELCQQPHECAWECFLQLLSSLELLVVPATSWNIVSQWLSHFQTPEPPNRVK